MGPFITAVVGAGLFYKIGQALFDEDFPGTDVPARVREQMISDYVSCRGWVCPKCNEETREFHVDHIIPIAAGGRNSRENLQILCNQCNWSKGSNYTFWERLRGRYADN